jgi:hypothetical protein
MTARGVGRVSRSLAVFWLNSRPNIQTSTRPNTMVPPTAVALARNAK